MKKQKRHFDRVVLLLQGGGALGAYQVGVYKGLHENRYFPDWVIGTSIGAINSAIIAGNRPDQQLKKLQSFWETISTKLPPAPDTINNIYMERWQHFLSAFITQNTGQPGFFAPRWWNPWIGSESTEDKLSYFDTEELHDTLLKFIDFDLLNEKKTRLSVGAVRIATGQLIYFDNTKIEIKPEHIMASGALPPGFPAVCIDNKMYWDGGVHSNTQISLLFEDDRPIHTLCFMVHLFDSFGTRPVNMDDVLKRQKDISYSSHHREFIQAYRSMHNLRHAIDMLSRHIPSEKKKDAKIKKLIELGHAGIIHVARFHYKGLLSDLSSKDYEFSLPSVIKHIQSGYDDVNRTMANPPWNKHHGDHLGLIIHELSEEERESVLER